jgi:hypothetical protein
MVIACFGFVCSLAWTLVNRGSKYWQENWEQKVEVIEPEVVGVLFGKQELREHKGPFSGFRFSVSRLTIALSDFAVLVWIGLSVREGLVAFGWQQSNFDSRLLFVVSAGGTLLYAAVMIAGSGAFRRTPTP